MIARTRIALLAFAGVLAGAAPAVAQTRPVFDVPPSATPSAATEATLQLGVVCTKCAAHVVCTAVPLYQEISALVQRLTAPMTAADVGPTVGAAKALGAAMFYVPAKDDQPQSLIPSSLEQIGIDRP